MLEALEYTIRYVPELGTVPGIEDSCTAAREYLAAPVVEPVGKVISSGPADFPIFQWISADHSLRCKTGDLLYTNPAQEAKQPVNQILVSALNAMLTHMGMDEDEWNKGTFDQARAAIKAAEQAPQPAELTDEEINNVFFHSISPGWTRRDDATIAVFRKFARAILAAQGTKA